MSTPTNLDHELARGNVRLLLMFIAAGDSITALTPSPMPVRDQLRALAAQLEGRRHG